MAILCPYVAGDAVYIARALYAQFDNSIFFDDLAICTPTWAGSERMLNVTDKRDTIEKPGSLSDYILVYPNPAKNILKVFYSSETNATITFELTDVTGKAILTRPLTSMTTIELDVSNIASGLYLWKGRDRSLIVKTGKVSIQK